MDRRSLQQRNEQAGKGTASALQYYAAPWFAPVHHRYETGNRHLMRLLEWVTAKTWPLAFVDEQCRWLEEGSASSRVLLGSVVAALLATLLSLDWAPMHGLQSIALQPVFDGHGVMVLAAAAFLVGATILPAVLGPVLAVLLRLYVLLNLAIVAALLGYGLWLLFSPAKP